MKIDEIYSRCAKYCQAKIPAEIGAHRAEQIIKVQSQVRDGLSFCGQYSMIAHQKLAEAKKRLAAARSLASIKIQEDIATGAYKDQIRAFTERRFLITTEANNKHDVFKLESEVETFKHLYQAIRDANNNLISLKEQLSSVIGLLRSEADLANKGGAYTTTPEEEFANVKF